MKLQLGKLKIEVKEFPFRLYDKDGNVTYYRDSDGYECLSQYDNKGNITHYHNSRGRESWREYDKNGNRTYYRNSRGYEWWAEYDENGNQTYFRSSNGYEWGTLRSKSCEGKIVEIDGKKYQLKELK